MKRRTIPLLGGARAVRPWGGLWIRERTHPGAAVKASQAFTPSEEWIVKEYLTDFLLIVPAEAGTTNC
jgi:hypothetical protein